VNDIRQSTAQYTLLTAHDDRLMMVDQQRKAIQW